MKDIHDVIKHAKFGDARLRDSGVVAGQISAFPIDFAGRPYNTLTLPCERVIMATTTQTVAKRLTYQRKLRVVIVTMVRCHQKNLPPKQDRKEALKFLSSPQKQLTERA